MTAKTLVKLHLLTPVGVVGGLLAIGAPLASALAIGIFAAGAGMVLMMIEATGRHGTLRYALTIDEARSEQSERSFQNRRS